MGPPPAEGAGHRLAVVGAETPTGAALREQLERERVPADRVDLFAGGDDVGEAILTEYRGEARLIQAPDEGVLAAHDVLFLCADGALPRRLADRAGRDRLVVDLAGVSGGPIVAEGAEPVSTGTVRVPHPIALALADLLVPLARGAGLRAATATVLRPASDLGDAAAEELRRQVTGLLGFAEVPTEHLGDRLAFDCLPQDGVGERAPEVRRRIEQELRRRVGVAPIAVQLIWIPRFHGHTVSVRVEIDGGVDEARDALRGAAGLEVRESPADCVGETTEDRPAIRVAVGDAGDGGAWLWASVPDAGGRAVAEAVLLARAAGRIEQRPGRTR
jgi:aspartate-semialdehyde dehydrogenase